VRARRLVSLLLRLQSHGRTSARELATSLGVSTRTVQRDVEVLIAAGVPIQAERGAAGGYALAPGYRTRLNGLSKDEAGALFLAGLPGAAAELGLGTVFTSARLKLLAALPAELRDQVSGSAQLFHLDAPGWFERAEKPPPQLAVVAGALWRSRRLNAHYRHHDGHGERRMLDPLGLVLKAGNWYLVAGCVDGTRVYRVARLSNVKVLDEEAVRPARFDLAAYWGQSLAEYEASRPQVQVRVRIARAAIPELERVLAPRDRATLRAALADAQRGEWLTLTVAFERSEHAHRDLLGLGNQVEVLGPRELRERIGASARTVAALYSASQHDVVSGPRGQRRSGIAGGTA
jgi:predicted DNA-binding transcriptional regulator YafY